MLTDEMRYKLLRVLQENPEASQRDIARKLDVSLGRVNFCLQALIRTGLVKAKNFSGSSNKISYVYLLTPRGIKQKATITMRYLRAKLTEYELLRNEIARLRSESNELSGD